MSRFRGKDDPRPKAFSVSRLPPFVRAAVPLGCRLLFFRFVALMIPPNSAAVNPFSIFLCFAQIVVLFVCSMNNIACSWHPPPRRPKDSTTEIKPETPRTPPERLYAPAQSRIPPKQKKAMQGNLGRHPKVRG